MNIGDPSLPGLKHSVGGPFSELPAAVRAEAGDACWVRQHV